MKIKLNGRYCLVKPPDAKKTLLVKVKYTNGKYTGIIQNNNAGTVPDEIALSYDDVIAVFPSDTPPWGNAYGAQVLPHLATKRIKRWGIMHVYRDMSDAEHHLLNSALSYVYKKFLFKYKLNYILPITIELKPGRGKVAGTWQTRDGESIMTLCPADPFTDRNITEIATLIAHEYGHGLWGYLPDTIKVKWVRLYHSTVKVEQLSLNDLKSMRTDFIASGSKPKQYAKELQDNHRDTFNACIDWIAGHHFVSGEYLDLLVSNGDDLKAYWPSSDLHAAEIDELVTEYAKKSPVELWCESVSLLGTKQALPAQVKKLMLRSITALQRNED